MRREQDFFEDDVPADNSVRNLWQAIDTSDRLPGRRSLWTILTLTATVGVLFAVLWYSYPREVEIKNRLSAPVLHADAQPARVPPDAPGGMDIPHRDSAVFDAINTAEAAETPSVENLLDAEEEPMPKARLFAGLNTDTIDSSKPAGAQPAPATPSARGQSSTAAEISEAPTPAEINPETAPSLTEDIDTRVSRTAEKVLKISPVIESLPTKTAVQAPETAKAPETVASAPKTSKPAAPRTVESENRTARTAARVEPAAGAALGAATKGSHFVQLSSVRERGRADSEWASLKRQFPGQLEALAMRVQEANLGAKGTYYRIQAGPVSKDRAASLCAAIKRTKPGGCLVVGR